MASCVTSSYREGGSPRLGDARWDGGFADGLQDGAYGHRLVFATGWQVLPSTAAADGVRRLYAPKTALSHLHRLAGKGRQETAIRRVRALDGHRPSQRQRHRPPKRSTTNSRFLPRANVQGGLAPKWV